MMLNAFMYISRLCRTGATAYSAFLIHNDTSVICYIMLDVSGIDIQCKVTYLINCGFHSRYCTESPAPVGFDESVVSLNVFRGHTSDVNCATVLLQSVSASNNPIKREDAPPGHATGSPLGPIIRITGNIIGIIYQGRSM